ncbi:MULTISPECIES: hypothetical protein [unclassified Rhizobium]|uniref:hypothetical protein n=1 Tax=unclassified Rhizobium TaxID=2613769 RepID=UPI001FEF9D64|nr:MULTISPECIES: hypothetical protein [unclassified Rhizobium]
MPVGYGYPVRSVMEASGILITRLHSDRSDLPISSPNEEQDAFAVIFQMIDFNRHRLWRRNQLVYEGDHPQAKLGMIDLRERWQSHRLSPFDSVHFQIPFEALRSFALDAGRSGFSTLHFVPGLRDEVVFGLSMALLPTL